MRFARPEWLWSLLLVPILAVWLAHRLVARRRALASFADEKLLPRLAVAPSLEILTIKTALLVGGTILLLLSAARPQWGTSLEQVSRRGVDVLVGIDISESMLGEDLSPSRLGKAREESSRLLDRLTGDRVGLMAFAGSGGVLHTRDIRAGSGSGTAR